MSEFRTVDVDVDDDHLPTGPGTVGAQPRRRTEQGVRAECWPGAKVTIGVFTGTRRVRP